MLKTCKEGQTAGVGKSVAVGDVDSETDVAPMLGLMSTVCGR